MNNMAYYDVSSYFGSEYTDKYNKINKNNEITNIKGYWLLSSHPGGSNSSFGIFYWGVLGMYGPSYLDYLGIRPVITVSKDYFN